MKDKRQGKLERHIPILIDGQTTPILSYSIKDISGPRYGKQRILTLKSMVKSAVFSPGLVGKTAGIIISTEKETHYFRGYCSGFFNSIPLFEMTFDLIENDESTP